MAADPTRPNPIATLGKLLFALIASGVLAAGLAMPYVGGLGFVADDVLTKFQKTTCRLQESSPPQKTVMKARDGKTVIATLFTQDRVPVSLHRIPKYLQDALIATEDRRFYQHHGVDLRGLIRSAVSTSSGNTQGGSTLTMQYVKQIRYYQASEIPDPKKREAAQQAAVDINLKRKLEDAKCALYFENTLHESKDRILDNYLNIAFFGENSYGIQVAAETYFNKPASELTLPESALLVGLLRAPTFYDPFLHRDNALQRRNEVLQNLVSVGKLSQAAADQAKATPIALATQSPPQVKQGCANATGVPNAGFFCEYVKNWLENVNGISETTLQTGGLTIVTTLDPNIQRAAQARITKHVPANSPMTAVLPVLQPASGDILAMASSKTYGAGKGQTEQPIFTSYTVNGASTYKLFPLLTALSTGIPSDWQLKTVGNDGKYLSACPSSKPVGNGDANVTYDPLTTLEQATAQSSNTYFLALVDQAFQCHLQPMVDIMKRLGMKALDRHDPVDNPKLTYAQNLVNHQRGQQLALGSVPTSALELAGAYAAVANEGVYKEPAPVLSITDSDGNSLPVKRATSVQAVAPQVAAQAVQILQKDTVADGTSASVFDSWYAGGGSEIAGKTGTNESTKKNKNSSVWFVGMTPKLVAASGLIDFDSSSAPSSDLKGKGVGQAYGDYAAKVWWDALKPVISGQSWTWPTPDQVDGQPVPTDITGQTYDEAKATLAAAGFKIQNLDATDGVHCASTEPYDTVAYFGPQIAKRGSVITVCLSSQVANYTPPPPPKPKPKPTTGHGRGNGGGTGGGGGGRNGGGGGGRNGGGTGGGTGGGGGGGGNGGGPRH